MNDIIQTLRKHEYFNKNVFTDEVSTRIKVILDFLDKKIKNNIKKYKYASHDDNPSSNNKTHKDNKNDNALKKLKQLNNKKNKFINLLNLYTILMIYIDKIINSEHNSDIYVDTTTKINNEIHKKIEIKNTENFNEKFKKYNDEIDKNLHDLANLIKQDIYQLNKITA